MNYVKMRVGVTRTLNSGGKRVFARAGGNSGVRTQGIGIAILLNFLKLNLVRPIFGAITEGIFPTTNTGEVCKPIGIQRPGNQRGRFQKVFLLGGRRTRCIKHYKRSIP